MAPPPTTPPSAARALLFFLGLVIALVIGCNLIGSSIVGRAQRGIPIPPMSTATDTGREARVRLSGGGDVVLARSADAMEDLLTAAAAQDKVAYDAVVIQGDAFLVSSGTRVRVIRSLTTLSEVRVLDGPFATQTGWVPREWVTP